MLPPDQDHADLAAAIALRLRQHRGQTGRAGAFGHGLLDIEQQRDAALELVFVDEHDVVHQRAHHLARQ